MGNPLNVGQPFNNGQMFNVGQMQQPDMNQLYQMFLQNPMKYLTGLNLPANICTPQQAVEFLANNGRIPPMLQAKVNQMLGR